MSFNSDELIETLNKLDRGGRVSIQSLGFLQDH
jgi:hypothetical protein